MTSLEMEILLMEETFNETAKDLETKVVESLSDFLNDQRDIKRIGDKFLLKLLNNFPAINDIKDDKNVDICNL